MLSMGTKSESSDPIPPIPAELPPPWTELPEDLTTNILQRLGEGERLESAQLVCSKWWRVCKNPTMWRVIYFDCERWSPHKFQNIFHCAVDRSQGQLVQLKLDGFQGTTGLLNYAAERSSQLRCLGLSAKEEIGSVLIEAIKKLPKLDTLLLMVTHTLSPTDFETIGVSCPMLESMLYSCSCYHLEFSEHGVAIGKNMPNLRYLELYVDQMECKGVEAVLDGIPDIKVFKLRHSSGFMCLKGSRA